MKIDNRAIPLIHRWAQAKWAHWIRANASQFAKQNGLSKELVIQIGLEVSATPEKFR